jgi:putative PIN family toxin of toxin-antitoxin system
MSMMRRIVIDSSVVVSGLMSRRGASFRLLQLVGRKRFTTVVSVPLVVEYEKVVLDPEHDLPYTPGEIGRFLDYFCAVSDRRKVFFLWRPYLRVPTDDMVLEAAVAGGCKYIVTFNTKDFAGVERFGIRALWPGDFLKILKEKK